MSSKPAPSTIISWSCGVFCPIWQTVKVGGSSTPFAKLLNQHSFPGFHGCIKSCLELPEGEYINYHDISTIYQYIPTISAAQKTTHPCHQTIWRFPIHGATPKSSISIGLSIINVYKPSILGYPHSFNSWKLPFFSGL